MRQLEWQDVQIAWWKLWHNKLTRVVAFFILACMFIGIGALWSPQSRAVSDLRTCLKQANQLHQSPDRCWHYVIKVGKS